KEKIDNLDVEDSAELHKISADVRKMIKEVEIPEELREEIISAYKEFSEKIKIEEPFVAIRSSATAEDLPEASFAGQQDTYLHISGADAVLEHAKKCWASLWTARAVYYRETQGFDHFDVALSVVVQKMINSEKSGVMFTANPVNCNIDELMINASWGLGEAIVGGNVTPDEYIVSKENKEIIEKHIAEKTVMIVKKQNSIGTIEGNVGDIIGPEKINEQCLTDDEIVKLSDYGIKIENMYKKSQDIEWAFDEDTKNLYILQSRPITTLKEVKGEEESMVDKEELKMLVRGLPASPGLASGEVRRIDDISEIEKVQEGDILVTV